MTPDTRRVIALIAAALANERPYGWVYDYDEGLHRQISVSQAEGMVGAYDHLADRYYDGKADGQIYDRTALAHIGAERTAKGIKGYDHGSASFYEAFVDGDSVSVFDHATARYHAYAAR
jgi:hypothetical protein